VSQFFRREKIFSADRKPQRRNGATPPCLKTVYAMRHAATPCLYVSKINKTALQKFADRFETKPPNRFGVAAVRIGFKHPVWPTG